MTKRCNIDISINIDDIKEEGYWKITESKYGPSLSKRIPHIGKGITTIHVLGTPVKDNTISLTFMTIKGKGSKLYGDKYFRLIEGILQNVGSNDNALPIAFVGGTAITAIPEIMKATPELFEVIEKRIPGEALKDVGQLFSPSDGEEVDEISLTDFLNEFPILGDGTYESCDVFQIQRNIINQLNGLTPEDVIFNEGEYSVLVFPISSGIDGESQLEKTANFFKLDLPDGEDSWATYDNAWDDITEKANEVADEFNENLELPGRVGFTLDESCINFGLYYFWKKGDHPEWEEREITEQKTIHVSTKDLPFCPDHPNKKLKFMGYGYLREIGEDLEIRYSIFRCSKDGRTYGEPVED